MHVSIPHYRRARRVILTLVLFFVALAVRAWRAFQQPVVNPDAIRFAMQAQRFGWDPLGAIRDEVYHPLHSLAGLGIHTLVSHVMGDERLAWLVSLQVVGVLCGAVVAVEIVAIARLIGAPRWAAYAAAAAWIVGRRTSAYGADGISDMLFLCLFGGAMIVGMRAMRLREATFTAGRGVAFFLAGVLAGLAYLTRPEGLAAPLILTIAMVLPYMVRSGPAPRRFKLMMRRRPAFLTSCMAVAWLFAGTALVAAPYMAAIGGITNKKSLVHTNVVTVLSVGPVVAALGPTSHSLLPSIGKVCMELWETFGFAPMLTLLLAMLIAPFFWGRPRLRMLVIVWSVVWFLVMLWLIHRASYLDGRHTLPLQLVLHALLAVAFLHWQRPMRWHMNFWRKRPAWNRLPAWMKWRRWPAVMSGGAIFLTLLPGLIELRTPPALDRRFLLDASAWVSTHLRSNVLVYEKGLIVGYYSGHPFQRLSAILTDDNRFRRPPRPAPHVLAIIYTTEDASPPSLRLGNYVAIASFASTGAAHGDVLVLYALPESDILNVGKVEPLSVVPGLPSARP